MNKTKMVLVGVVAASGILATWQYVDAQGGEYLELALSAKDRVDQHQQLIDILNLTSAESELFCLKIVEKFYLDESIAWYAYINDAMANGGYTRAEATLDAINLNIVEAATLQVRIAECQALHR